LLYNSPIRYKLLFKLGLLFVIVVALSVSGMTGLYSYRQLAKSISGRSAELPLATQLGQHVTDLRVTLTEIHLSSSYSVSEQKPPLDTQILHAQFGMHLQSFTQTLVQYRKQLTGNEQNSPTLGESHRERETVRKIEETLTRISTTTAETQWMRDDLMVARLDTELQKLQQLSAELPSYLHGRMQKFTDEVRIRYRTLIGVTWITTVSVAVMLFLFVRLFMTWIFRPLRILIKGSRRVAGGDFSHRIRLDSEDEMSELANAMNNMTERFQTIRDHLDSQVKERTMQVVRSSQLASVGFLAAGVAHEINNPMAAIAMSAESLERQLNEGAVPDKQQAEGARSYLRMIQDEAFRCKSITDQLLDFSRTGDGQRQNADLRELILGVIEMVRHLAKNEERNVALAPCKSVIATIHPQEIKQVVLNLITNALDSTDPGGTVTIELGIQDGKAQICVSDNGCGMTDEVRENLFEPFFTRRRSGQGTGLGLAIASKIVADHGGRIHAESDGPGCGSQFRVALPLAGTVESEGPRYQAA
jgi:signal transduction histidine kinase